MRVFSGWRSVRILVLCPAGLTGCSISPAPEDMTGQRFTTNLIAHHVRCEARAGIKEAIVDYLKHIKRDDEAQRLIRSELSLKQLNAIVLPPARGSIAEYEGAAITYDFTLNMTEQNTVIGSVDIAAVVTGGVVSAGPNGTADLKRQGIRIFRITESFKDLIDMTGRCPLEQTAENFTYPITGNIGLGEYIKTFVDLNEYQKLSASKDAKTEAPTIAHTFNFTTTYTGTVGAKTTLVSAGRPLYVCGAGLSATGMRQDLHSVIVGLSLPTPSEKAPASLGPKSLLIGKAAPKGTTKPESAKDRSIDAVDNAINRAIINRLTGPSF